jgi:hypothetical protein
MGYEAIVAHAINNTLSLSRPIKPKEQQGYSVQNFGIPQSLIDDIKFSVKSEVMAEVMRLINALPKPPDIDYSHIAEMISKIEKVEPIVKIISDNQLIADAINSQSTALTAQAKQLHKLLSQQTRKPIVAYVERDEEGKLSGIQIQEID